MGWGFSFPWKLAVALMAALCLPAPASRAAEPPLAFGIIAAESAGALRAKWGPVVDDLSAALGRRVELRTYEDYVSVVWSMRDGEIQLAWTGNKAAILAVDRAGAEIFAQKIDAGGRDGYRSLMVARADSTLGSAADMLAQAGVLTYGQGDPQSTSGRLVPDYYLFARQRLEPRRLFKRVIQGSHEENFRAVVDGRADVVALASDHFDGFCRARPQDCAGLRIIWQSPVIPLDPLLWRKDLAADMQERVRAFFLEYGREGAGKPAAAAAEERRRLAALGLSRFRASDNLQLEVIRVMEAYFQRARAEIESSQGSLATTGR